MTGPRFAILLGLLSACGGGSGASDAGPADVSERPDGSRVVDATSIAGDAASSSGDAAPRESEFLPMARRACAEICRCGKRPETEDCAVSISGCRLGFSTSLDICARGFVKRMEHLKSYCPGFFDPCKCQWLEECRHWALTVVCDERDEWRGRPVEQPPQCTEEGGPPFGHDDPTCEDGPLRQCDAGVR